MLPQAFIDQMTELLGPSEAEALCRAIDTTPPVTSIRINPAKPAACPDGEAVPWCAAGRYLTDRPQFTLDPLFHAGAYYVQEASSMFIEQAWRTILERQEGLEPLESLEKLAPIENLEPLEKLAPLDSPKAPCPALRLLDLCAAPGGKSTLWRSLLPDGSLLVANEPIRQRAQVLAENLTKWGHPDVVVTSAYPDEFAPLGSFFDIIAADVPCSGEGMFRKDEGAREEWSPEAVIACAERQWGIISDVWPALRQGGWLVYSTCTFNAEEDEHMVARICRELGAEVVPIAHDPAWQIVEGKDAEGNTLGYHFYPHRTKGEGIYMCLLHKTSEAPTGRSSKKEKKGKKGAKQSGKSSVGGSVRGGSTVAPWLACSADFKFFSPTEEHIGAVRQSLFDPIIAVTGTVRALTAGILLAEEKGKKLIPQHALAMSTALADDAFPRQELDLDSALAYLRREAITLPADCPRGYVVVTHKGRPLGFVNNLGSRANNLYPEQWRIRHQ